jgi:hypothetical protein
MAEGEREKGEGRMGEEERCERRESEKGIFFFFFLLYNLWNVQVCPYHPNENLNGYNCLNGVTIQ